MAPGPVFRWIFGGIRGPLGHHLGGNGRENALEIRKESVPKVLIGEV